MWPGLLAVIIAVIIVVLVLAWRAGTHGSGSSSSLPSDIGVVTHIVDGDTIDIDIAGRDERVRFIGVNTPETHLDNGPPECFGPEAAEYTASLLPLGSEVRLTRDVVGRDDYGRLLAYVYRRRDDLFVNEDLAAGGYARLLTIRPNDAFADEFATASAASERAGLGLWGACPG